MNKIHKIEGVVLKSFPFQDHHLIITIFSFEEGLVRLIAKGFSNPKKPQISQATPLTQGEFVYVESRGELQKCKEISLIDAHLKLRNSLKNLEAGGRIIKSLLQSQLPCTPAPDLYRLLIKYLKKIPEIPEPSVLATSFLLKILLHDGLVDYRLDCQPPFSHEEWHICQILALTRSFSDLQSSRLSTELNRKIEDFFLCHCAITTY